MDPAHAALLAGAGFLAGVCNAVAGGGTLLTFPALLATGLPPVAANVTNTVAVWPGYLGGTAAFRERLRERRPLIARLLVTALLGGVVGTVLLLAAPAEVFDAVVPYLVLGATAIFGLQPMLTRRLNRRRSADTADGTGSEDRTVGAPLTAAMFLGGAYGAYFGGGLGFILLAVLMLGVSAELRFLNGVKALLSLGVNTVALLVFVVFGDVHWLSVAIIGPLCLLGGVVGGRLAQRLSATALRTVVVVFGLAVGVAMLR
ncbi:sulfite exporter TauE/SafE family protein [Actinomadura craniellae]|uniref:Probable membrane transporter protein n=1 Tax=Actinomadura craniellae TaxID=2231787 RepID=A0A365HAE0_9ACTN|nr:sulfite exporter TauE/SafE family protein [Actinomadura craniellae]RAY16065.1 sulfite exporter TauE/SafE family protein [Actinomadura craniellae]